MEFSHLDELGQARMVDIATKAATTREAVAEGFVKGTAAIMRLLAAGAPKGDVLATARIAGVMAAKKTAELIPLCHQVPLDSVKVELVVEAEQCRIRIIGTARCHWKTGVEMEALTAVSVAALTVYDMCKAVDRGMMIEGIRLLSKTGGRSGAYRSETPSGQVVAVNRSQTKGVPKTPIPAGEFLVDHGLEGDAHAGNWHRQVSLLGQESIAKMTAQGVNDLLPGRFAENITTQGIVLYDLAIGTRLRIGSVILEVTQIGKECHQKCAIYRQVGDCVMPHEGIFARVVEGGVIRPGEQIIVETIK